MRLHLIFKYIILIEQTSSMLMIISKQAGQIHAQQLLPVQQLRKGGRPTAQVPSFGAIEMRIFGLVCGLQQTQQTGVVKLENVSDTRWRFSTYAVSSENTMASSGVVSFSKH
jgi:hypothetical protein